MSVYLAVAYWMEPHRHNLMSDLEAEAFFVRDMFRLIYENVKDISPTTLDDEEKEALSLTKTLTIIAKDRAEKVCDQINGLYSGRELQIAIETHKAAFAEWSEADDQAVKSHGSSLHSSLNQADSDLLAFVPTTLEQVRTKAEYMASSSCFAEWDNIDRSEIIKGLTPEVSA